MLLGACLSFIIPLSVYVLTLAPTVTFGDSGELITAAYSLGISHPPGSPLWTILAHLFTYLPINSVAWRVNLASAAFAALTGLVLFQLILHIFRDQKKTLSQWQTATIALCSSLFFSFSRSLWRTAIVAEVYSLNALIFSLILLSVYSWCQRRKFRYLCISSLFLGLGLANHYIFFLLIPVYGLWLLLTERRILFSRKVILLTITFLLGLSVYLYIPLRAHTHPVINWGNPETLKSFWVYLQRKELSANLIYKNINVGVNLPIGPITSVSEVVQRSIKSVTFYSISTRLDFSPLLIVFFFCGAIVIAKIQKKGHAVRSWFLFLVLSFLSTSLGYAFLINSTHIPADSDFPEYFFSFIILCIVTGYGLYLMAVFFRNRKQNILLCGILLAAFVIPVAQVVTLYQQNDWSHHRVAYDHAMNILNTVKPNAIIFSGKNIWTFPLLYITKVEHRRPDVTIYDRSGNLFELIYRQSSQVIQNQDDFERQRQEVENKIITKNPTRPIYYATDKDFENYPHEATSEGILYRTKGTLSQSINFQDTYKSILSIESNSWKDDDTSYVLSYYHLRFADSLTSQNDKNNREKEYEQALLLGYSHKIALNNVAIIFAKQGKADKAAELFKRVITLDPANMTAHLNLAGVYEKSGKTQDAIDVYKAIIELSPTATEVRVHVASLLESTKKYEEALREYEALLPQLADKKPVLERISKVAFELGNCDKGEEIVSGKEQPTNLPVVYNNLGVCWARKNQLDKAKTAWQKAVDLDGSYQEPKNNLIRLEQVPH